MSTESEGAPTNSRRQVISLDRALQLLDAFPATADRVALAYLAEKVGLPPSTAHRLLQTLAQHGFVVNDGRGSYALGLKVWEVGSLAVRQRGLTPLMYPYLERLVAEVGETGHIAVLDRYDIVYVGRLSGHKAVSVHTYLGQRAPAYCTATGKAILTRQPPHVVREVLEQPLKAYTARTCVDAEEIRRQLETGRKQGYVANTGEWQEDLSGVAAPVLDFTGYSIGAIGAAGPRYRYSSDSIKRHGAIVAAIAQEMSRDMGLLQESAADT